MPGPGSYGNPYAFEQYGVGRKRYGGGRSAPNVGPVSASGRMGYAERDQRTRMRRNALLRRMKATQKKRYFDPAYLRGQA